MVLLRQLISGSTGLANTIRLDLMTDINAGSAMESDMMRDLIRDALAQHRGSRGWT